MRWLITNRKVTGGQFTTDFGALTYWTFDPSQKNANITDPEAWTKYSLKQFKDALVEVASKFPAPVPPPPAPPTPPEEQKHLTLFIHGYKNAWVDSISRYDTIARQLFDGDDSLGELICFDWPSKGELLAYLPDRAEARQTADNLTDVLEELYDWMADKAQVAADNPANACRAKTSIIAHSMGNYALRHALQALMRLPVSEAREYAPASGSPPIPSARSAASTAGEGFPALIGLPTENRDPNRLRRTFDQIILAAADEDEDAFEDELELKYLPRLAAGVTVYHTGRDWILNTLSRYTKFNGPRLGSDGPENMASISDKVSAVDVTQVIDPKQDFESHQYYRLSPAVRDDIVAVLNGARPDQIANRKPTDSPRRYRLVGTVGAKTRKSPSRRRDSNR